MVTQTMTLPEFERYMGELPKKMIKYTEEINIEMAKSLQRRIKTRLNPTGFFSIGFLKKEIKVEGKPDSALVTGPRYWKYVNRGIGPKVPIPLQFLEQHMTNPNQPGQFVEDPIWVNTDQTPIKFDANKGFVDQARLALEQDIPKIIDRGFAKATRK